MFHEIPPLTEVSAANATVGAIVNSIHNDTIAENNRFFISLGEQHKKAEFYLRCYALPSVYCTVNRLVKFFFTAYTSFCQIKRRRG